MLTIPKDEISLAQNEDKKYPCQATKTDISVSGCLQITTMPARNALYCQGCGSPWRSCWFCLVQGYSAEDSSVIDCATGLCKFHTENGKGESRSNVSAKNVFEHSKLRSSLKIAPISSSREIPEEELDEDVEHIELKEEEESEEYVLEDEDEDEDEDEPEQQHQAEQQSEPEVELPQEEPLADVLAVVPVEESPPTPELSSEVIAEPAVEEPRPAKKQKVKAKPPPKKPKAKLPTKPKVEKSIQVQKVVPVLVPIENIADEFLHGVSLASVAARFPLLRLRHIQLITLTVANKSKKEICEQLLIEPIYFASLSSAARAILGIPPLSHNKSENTKMRTEVMCAAYTFLQKSLSMAGDVK
jgi:hypothetical protein